MSDNNNDTKQPLNKDFREPKIRFPEFIKPWGQHKLGDLCDVYTGGEAPEDSIQTKVAINEYKYPIYSNGIGENALWGYSKSYRIDVPAITFSSIGTLGYPEIREPYFTPIIRLKVIIPKTECDLYYLKCSLSCKPFPYNAGGIPNINAKTLKDISLIFTSDLGEQEKIGLLFRNLDSLIDINRHECDTLKKYREGLIQSGLYYLSKNSTLISFASLFNPISIPNTQMLPQYTVGVQGLKPLDDVRYDISKHKTFSENTLILGIGLEEIGISEQLVGSISPVYDVYEINDPSLTKYFKYFLKPMLWKQRNYLSRKSTRREFEVDTNELRKTLIPIPNNNHFNYFIGALETMDNLIENIEKQTERLLSIKDFLLGNMFT